MLNNSYSFSQNNNKRFQRQLNVLRNLYHAQNSLLGVYFPQTFFFTFCIHHFICPFREQPPVNSYLFPFPFIQCNSIPYTLLKTHILFSLSNHELYFILSFCRLVNIKHPKPCHLHSFSLKSIFTVSMLIRLINKH